MSLITDPTRRREGASSERGRAGWSRNLLKASQEDVKDVERKETKTRVEGAGVGRLEHKLVQEKKSRRKLRVVSSYFYFTIKYGNIVNKSL